MFILLIIRYVITKKYSREERILVYKIDIEGVSPLGKQSSLEVNFIHFQKKMSHECGLENRILRGLFFRKCKEKK